MCVKRVISNNAVLALDADGQEMVALGRGLGHGRRPGEVLETDWIEQVFVAGDADERLTRFLADVPLQYVRVAGRIADLAHERLGLARFQFEMNLGEKLSTDEVAYLALHVARLLWDLRDGRP